MNEYKGLYCDLTSKVINAAIEVHTEFGCGLKEEAYEAALAWELSQRGHKVLRQVPCPVIYTGKVFCQDDEHPKRIDPCSAHRKRSTRVTPTSSPTIRDDVE